MHILCVRSNDTADETRGHYAVPVRCLYLCLTVENTESIFALAAEKYLRHTSNLLLFTSFSQYHVYLCCCTEYKVALHWIMQIYCCCYFPLVTFKRLIAKELVNPFNKQRWELSTLTYEDNMFSGNSNWNEGHFALTNASLAVSQHSALL